MHYDYKDLDGIVYIEKLERLFRIPPGYSYLPSSESFEPLEPYQYQNSSNIISGICKNNSSKYIEYLEKNEKEDNKMSQYEFGIKCIRDEDESDETDLTRSLVEIPSIEEDSRIFLEDKFATFNGVRKLAKLTADNKKKGNDFTIEEITEGYVKVPKGLLYNMSMLTSEKRQIENYILNKSKKYNLLAYPELYHSKDFWKEYESVHAVPGRKAIELYYTYYKDRCIYCHLSDMSFKKSKELGKQNGINIIAHKECREINWCIDYFLQWGFSNYARLDKTSRSAVSNKVLRWYMGFYDSRNYSVKTLFLNAMKNIGKLYRSPERKQSPYANLGGPRG